MKRQIISLLGLALFFLCHSSAHAVSVDVTVLQASQSASAIRAGLVVTGKTDWYTVSVAGGFTISCDYTSLTLDAQSGDTRTDYFRLPGTLELTVAVPDPGPGSYVTAGYHTIPMGECRTCYLKWTGTATGESLGFSGLGFNVTFSTGAVAKGDSVSIAMCRNPPSGGSCDPP